jgi:hypothetical protein
LSEVDRQPPAAGPRDCTVRETPGRELRDNAGNNRSAKKKRHTEKSDREEHVDVNSTGYDPVHTIVDGITAYAAAINDQSVAEGGVLAYRLLAREIRQVMRPGDTCRLALSSTIVTPDVRVGCFVIVLQDRILIAFRRGMFRKTSETVVIPISSITGVRSESGTSIATLGTQLLTIFGEPSVTIALPVRTHVAAANAIRRAIATPDI